jgi:hypothetical protein
MSREGEAEAEARTLAPWLAAHAALHGSAPTLTCGPEGSTLALPPWEDGLGLFRRMMGTVEWLLQKPRMVAHVRALGFAWGEDGVLLGMPTPSGLKARLRALHLSSSGFAPDLVSLDGLDPPAGAWLARLMRGVVTMNVGTARLYERTLEGGSTPRGRARHEALVHHLLALPHDMTKHVLTFHLVPRSCVLDLGARARLALRPPRAWLANDEALGRARLLGRLPKEWQAPLPLLTFYENDLVDYCSRVFGAIDRPEEFAPTFARPAHYAQLTDVLARRVGQIGRVSGLFRDVPPRPYARFEIDR